MTTPNNHQGKPVPLIPEDSINLPSNSEIQEANEYVLKSCHLLSESLPLIEHMSCAIVLFASHFTHFKKHMSRSDIKSILSSYDQDELNRLWQSCIENEDFTLFLRMCGWFRSSFCHVFGIELDFFVSVQPTWSRNREFCLSQLPNPTHSG